MSAAPGSSTTAASPELRPGSLDDALAASHVTITDDTKKTFSDVRGGGESWKQNGVFVNFATKLDESNLCYMIPDMHQALCYLTGEDVDYIEACTANGAIALYLIGFYEKRQPLGPFWDRKFRSKTLDTDAVSPRVARILAYARAMQEALDQSDENKRLQWQASFREGYKYLTYHRRTVRKVGDILDTDMHDHDLTKTRVVQLALGYMWHWGTNHTESEAELKELGTDCIRAGHLESEDHHPEYESAHPEHKVDVCKLFSDRLAVHLQKDERDDQQGWAVTPSFIPEEYREHFREFHEKHRGKDLYQAWDEALRQPVNIDD